MTSLIASEKVVHQQDQPLFHPNGVGVMEITTIAVSPKGDPAADRGGDAASARRRATGQGRDDGAPG